MKHSIGLKILSVYIWVVSILITIVVTIAIALSCLVFGIFDRKRTIGHAIGYLWGSGIIACNPLWRLDIIGRKNIPKDQACVLVSNHASLADIVILYKLHRQFKWVAREDLFRVPFLGWSMRLNKYVELERGRHGSIKKSYGKARGWLEKGISVLLFPEGTRSRTNELGPFKNGAFRLAIESGVPIVPIVIRNSFHAIPSGTWIFDRVVKGNLTVFPPIETRGLTQDDAESLKQKVHTLTQEHLAKTPRK